MTDKHYVYILRCGDGSLYTGYAVDIAERLEKHSQGKGAKYTRGRGPLELVYHEEYKTKEEALKREWQIKQLTRKEKISLIEGNGDEPLETGTLYLCATPIGNMEDITLRVLRVLKEVDLIAAEDTRHTRKLLSFYDIHRQLTSYHEHNKKAKGPVLIEKLLAGSNIALVTDAGTPGISDPGEDLVKEAIANNITVVSLPGASAFVTALTVSGLPTNEFSFYGFLPAEKKQRREKLDKISGEQKTIILYEAPHRLKTTLADLKKSLGNRELVLVRELTKKFEEVIRGPLEDLITCAEERQLKGEMCLIIKGNEEELTRATEIDIPIEEQVQQYIKNGLSKKEAIKEVARVLGLPKREVYNAVISGD